MTILNKADIQLLFNLSERQTKALFKTEGFPAVSIGARQFVDSSRLTEWMKEHEGKKIVLNYDKV